MAFESTCEKHGKLMKHKYVGRGKTIEICEDCEKEMKKGFEKLFKELEKRKANLPIKKYLEEIKE